MHFDFSFDDNQFVGILPNSLIDFPGCISTILFTFGCPFRCPYCYNVATLFKEYRDYFDLEYLIEYLTASHIAKKFIDGLVITGGEPLMWKNILDVIEYIKIKFPKLKIKIDTNGAFPSRLKEIIDSKLVDYIAMDIKFSNYEDYKKITKLPNISYSIFESKEILLNQKEIDYEFRITVFPPFFKNIEEDAKNIGMMLKKANKIYLQQFVNSFDNYVDNQVKNILPYSNETLLKMKDIIVSYSFCENVYLR